VVLAVEHVVTVDPRGRRVIVLDDEAGLILAE
jgi:hypothetical protein